MMSYGFAEIVNRVIKYLIEGLVVAAVVFAILDAVSPSMGVTSRQGAGLGLGFKLVGFPA